MWFFVKEDSFYYIRVDGDQTTMVNRIEPVNPGRGLVLVSVISVVLDLCEPMTYYLC